MAACRDPEFLVFWGKARPAEGAVTTWHPAAFHNLDVAAVAEALLSAYPAASRHMAAACGWAADDFAAVMVFLIALHDIGKFSKPFQAKSPEHWPALLGPYRNKPGPRHDAVGLSLLREDRILDLLEPVFQGWPDAAIEIILSAVAGHHGRPVGSVALLDVACATCRDAACCFADAVAELLAPPALAAPPKRMARVLSWWVAGLTTLCDWIGSATHWFAYEGGSMVSVAEYWPIARRRAAIAVLQSGMLPARTEAARGVAGVLPDGATPTPVQALAAGIVVPEGPVSILVEDATGGGKTEAALILAQALICAGRADGLFVALPTMATADAMFARLGRSYRNLFAADAQPSLALAHGRAGLNSLFQGSILGPAEASLRGEMADGDDTASAQCAAWLAEERRRVFLAHVGVGTIDQALLGVLTARHAALRLFGLARKVLVIDEAHAYDPYMAEELDRLLMFHAALGGSSIVLSATLPRKRRAELLRAFASGLGTGGLDALPHVPALSGYPLVTVAAREGSFECASEMRAVLRRDLAVRRLGSIAEAVMALADAARGGACGIWVRNTVDDARLAALALRASGIEAVLFHARFAMGDRLAIQNDVLEWFGKSSGPGGRAPGGIGRVLVATQVVEQSLDLDADVMVTDLAPVDLLIQRAGRLHRHPGRERPEGFDVPELLVVSPDPVSEPKADWAADEAIGGSGFVYFPHVLWLSARALFAAGCIRVPDGVRALVEAVHGDDGEALPTGLLAAEIRATGNRIAERGQARGNLLDPAQGYSLSSGPWESDVRMPTRLGEPYVMFRMAREEHGALVPWCADADRARAWALSEISLRHGVADAEALAARLLPAVGRLRAGWGTWQQEIPILVLEPDGSGGWSAEAMRGEQVVRLWYESASGLAGLPFN